MPRWSNGGTPNCATGVVDRCAQLYGGYGYMREYLVARAVRSRTAGVQTIFGGTTEIMKEIIGRGLGV